MKKMRLIRWGIVITMLPLVLWALTGHRLDVWMAAYVVAFGATTLYAMLILDDDLARERFSPPEPGADALSLRFVRLLALAHIIAAILDIRWGLMPPVPTPIRASALVVMTAALTLIFRAMHENHFFSAVVRIQRDRGHRVVDSGPYALVRHPGYLGMVVAVPTGGLALGSWLGFAVGLVYSALVLRRVLFEDRFLRDNLDGYAEYASRVPHRLIPGVW